jgi:hypothetical protein
MIAMFLLSLYAMHHIYTVFNITLLLYVCGVNVGQFWAFFHEKVYYTKLLYFFLTAVDTSLQYAQASSVVTVLGKDVFYVHEKIMPFHIIVYKKQWIFWINLLSRPTNS